jgi:hypothetical protein
MFAAPRLLRYKFEILVMFVFGKALQQKMEKAGASTRDFSNSNFSPLEKLKLE